MRALKALVVMAVMMGCDSPPLEPLEQASAAPTAGPPARPSPGTSARMPAAARSARVRSPLR